MLETVEGPQVGDLHRNSTWVEAIETAWQEVQRRGWHAEKLIVYGQVIRDLEQKTGQRFDSWAGVPYELTERPVACFRCLEGDLGLELALLN